MSTVVRRAIYNRLASDTIIRSKCSNVAPGYPAVPGVTDAGVYHNVAPDHAKPPFVIFSKSSGVPTDTFKSLSGGVASALETDVWMIKAVDRSTTADTAELISAQITSVLNDADLGGNGVPTMFLRRESDVEYSELTDGDLYQHVGALYRLVRY